MKTDQSRRKFLATTVAGTVATVVSPASFAGTGAITAPTIIPREVFGANDRLRVAVLGVNGRGYSHVRSIMSLNDAEVVALSDPDMDVLTKRAKDFEQAYKKKVLVEQDFRKIYENKNIDAVTIASPNHWHALQAIWACQAGKDVFVEKPGTHNIYEGRKLIEAAYKYHRIVQHGVQLRSFVRDAVEQLHNGLIGRVYMARGIVYRWRPDIGNKGISKLPAGLNYDLWCGPAPMVPFTQNLVHYNWHWHWNYGNGDVGNQGIHQTDLCMWGLDVGLPERIISMGGKFLWDDCKEVPEIQTSIYHYPKEKKIIQFEVRNWCTNKEDDVDVANIFYGDKGYMVISGDGYYQTYLGQKREKGPGREKVDGDKANGVEHFKNWVSAIKARDMSIQYGPVETVHLSSALAHLGNISYRLGQQLDFDPVAERFIGNEDANNMLSREYRAPYVLPDQV